MALKQTEKLKGNVEEQLERLVKQLEDLEQYREDLEPEEYQETKAETLEQMREFQSSLAKLAAGDLSLTDYFAAIQLSIHAALSEVFKTPEVILMFAKKQPEQLRLKLATIQRDAKLGKLSSQQAHAQQVEVLGALKGLGEILSTEEANLLEKTNSVSLQQFIKVSTNPDSKGKLLALAENSLSLQQGQMGN